VQFAEAVNSKNIPY